MRSEGSKVIGFSHECQGFGELKLLDETILLEVPGGLENDLAVRSIVDPRLL
jgi:hypothetical protein